MRKRGISGSIDAGLNGENAGKPEGKTFPSASLDLPLEKNLPGVPVHLQGNDAGRTRKSKYTGQKPSHLRLHVVFRHDAGEDEIIAPASCQRGDEMRALKGIEICFAPGPYVNAVIRSHLQCAADGFPDPVGTDGDRIDSNARDSLADAQRFFHRIFVITVHPENGVRAELHPTGRLVEYKCIRAVIYLLYADEDLHGLLSALLKPIAYLYNRAGLLMQ